jgi:para-nitrobenzyl esterase
MDLRRQLPLCVLLLLATVGCGPTEADTTAVHVSAGDVRGVRDGAVTRFRGVPYAAPPVGDLRWRPPQPAPSWTGTRAATTSGPACAQGPARPEASEDCLHLDVTVPAGGGRAKPVMVWLHGGGFSEGAGSDYDPRRLATAGDVIVVSVDFRLGVYGFYGLPGLDGSGTFGLQDQQAALRWVRENIGSFGGDPGTVTVFGESGGAIGTCLQLLSPGARGLFHRAVLQSGTCTQRVLEGATWTDNPAFAFVQPSDAVERNGVAAAAALGCGRSTTAETLTCLRALPTGALDAQHAMFGAAAYGNPTVPTAPADALARGDVARVPVLAGFTRDEHRFTAGLLALAGYRIPAADLPRLFAQGFGARAPEVLDRYRSVGDAALVWSAAYTDAMWVCPGAAVHRQLAAHVPVFTYEFADENAQPFVDLPADFPAGASHASELPNLFEVKGRRPVTGDRYTDGQRALADTMIGYWTAFARTGDPNHDGAPTWPRGTTLRLAPGDVSTVDLDATHRCRFWQQQSPR